MRICVVCHDASLTGAPRIGFDLALFLAESHEVHLVVKTGGPLLDQPRYARLKATCRNVDTLLPASDLPYADRREQAVRILEDIQPDLLYVNSVAAGDWCEAGARTGAAVVLHTHEMRDSLPYLLSRVASPRLAEWVDLLVGASRTTLDDLQEVTGVRFENSLDFGIFIDTETVLAQGEMSVAPPVNTRGGSPDGKRRMVAMCGHAQPRKGPDIFFDLACRLPQYDFLWIGAWEPPDTLQNDAVVERYRSQSLENFYVTGLTQNPFAYLRSVDAFLLTSREDPNPLVVAEVLLFGKKAIAFSETGGSKALLYRFGYVLSGAPDCDRAEAVLPDILEGEDGPWLSRLAEDVKSEVDGGKKLAALQRILEDLAEHRQKQVVHEVVAQEGVSRTIHPSDHIFRWLVEDCQHSFKRKEEAMEYYFTDGRDSAIKFSSLLDELMPEPARRIDVLEFASGYGRVSRHWKSVIPNVHVTCCDIHGEAVGFLGTELGLPAVLSNRHPEGLRLTGEYDVVFALSFFSHMPRTTWGCWLEVLFGYLKSPGFLMFTTHGPASLDHGLMRPGLGIPDDGFWFRPESEQKDLPVAEYGNTFVTPDFVFNEIDVRLGIRNVLHRPAFWWNHQDLYVIKNEGERRIGGNASSRGSRSSRGL